MGASDNEPLQEQESKWGIIKLHVVLSVFKEYTD